MTANKPVTIYYTTNGTTPSTSSPVYATPLTFNTTTTLKYFAKDSTERTSAVQTQTYTYDASIPTVTVSPDQGEFYGAQKITLTASEPATIYYTTDGSEPATSSPVYSAPITISKTTTLKFWAKDATGNRSATYTKTYTITILKNPGVSASCMSAACHKPVHDMPEHNLDCLSAQGCHMDPSPAARATLAFYLNCSGCHNTFHNVTAYPPFPVQIPKYAGYLWSQPTPYTIWKGDGWTAYNGTVFDQKMMAFTNYRKDVDKTTLKNWYTAQMSRYGWVLNNMIYDGPDYVKIPYKIQDSVNKQYFWSYIWIYGSTTKGWAVRVFYGSTSTI